MKKALMTGMMCAFLGCVHAPMLTVLPEQKNVLAIEDPAPVVRQLYAVPLYPGRETTITILASDTGYNAGIEKLILYENKHIAWESDGPFGSSVFNQVKVVPGIVGPVNYYVEAIDRGGNEVLSDKLTINFSGADLDEPPRISNFEFLRPGVLWIKVIDRGEFAGLEMIVISENDRIIKEIKPEGSSYADMILIGKPSGKTVYKLQVFDTAGHETQETLVWE